MSSSIRLFVQLDLYLGGQLEIRTGQLHYLRNVMRLGLGAEFLLFNGQNGEFLGEIVDIKKRSILVSIKDQVRVQYPDSDIWLLFSPIKRSGVNFIIEKATELGVTKLLPVLTDYTNTDRVNTDRLNTIAIEAAEQCRRLTVPDIAEPRLLNEVLDQWNPIRRLLVMDETLATIEGVKEKAVRMAALKAKGYGVPCDAILIGPEGGFSEAELDKLGKQAFVKKITLGQRVLRAETAAAVALGLWNELIEIRN
jgi:16S rRNA (uracil1498-N3)-methyltransferase